MSTFKYNNQIYEYANHPAERTVEVPIGKQFVEQYKDVLEVGNVLRYFYSDCVHPVLDKYEKLSYVINEDIVNYKPDKLYDAILCISTLEHVGDGWAGEPKNRIQSIMAYINMQKLLKPGGVLFCTWPIGFNTDLDTWLKEGILDSTDILGMKRISEDNQWIEVDLNEVYKCKYETPFIAGNGVVFVYYQNLDDTMKYKKLIDFSSGLINPKEYDFLVDYCRRNNIKSVLEFGPGISTYAFMENSCDITSLEYQQWYYDLYKDKFNVVLFENTPIIKLELDKVFDMAFIDSPVGVNKSISRLNSCEFASKYTKRILLHDSNRIGEIVTQMIFTERGWNVRKIFDSYCGISEMIR